MALSFESGVDKGACILASMALSYCAQHEVFPLFKLWLEVNSMDSPVPALEGIGTAQARVAARRMLAISKRIAT